MRETAPKISTKNIVTNVKIGLLIEKSLIRTHSAPFKVS
jgi:hypothetical protein